MRECVVVQQAKSGVEELDVALQQLRDRSHHLAVHLCEEEAKFNLEECLATFKTFCEKVQQCRKVIV